MRAPISIIIPTLDAADGLTVTIPSLMEGLEAGLVRELILSDGGSTDATRAVADAAGAVWLTAPVSRSVRLRRGADAARGDWLMFLESGTALSKGWARDLGEVLQTPGAHHFRLRFHGRALFPRMAAGVANLRAGMRLPDREHGLLIDRATYDAVGGYPDLPLMEDVAIARALGARLGSLPVYAETCPRTYAEAGWLRRGTRNTVNLVRYLGGTDPAALHGAYRG
ncbi:glycosyltransferase [Puniceibacterium sediminis]|uniref:Glycosyltransferase 2-like domain-containing protein n=1 Tax=Puniceibacterium sediminis TaxID=1608407 RepID=A0A238UV86_9RHOB|nr:glycosyltransferase [Puniceibacterium sediminis]SNR25647.1 hypothetical protein SAMN06265370_101132 [Puniceibacterium sediminis]